MANQKIIISVAAQQCLAGVWQGKQLQTHQVFAHDETAYAAFDHFLSQYPKHDVYVLVDAMEEEYRIEALPYVRGAARRELIERKLAQFSRNSEYRAAQWVGQDFQKRREDLYLFASLANAEFMQVWIDLLQQRHMSLVGVYLLPLTLPYIVQQMKLETPHLLLCEKLSSGLRQTYLHQGRVRLSRLISMQHVKPTQLAYFYLVEIEKTRLYLLSQRLIDDKTDLQLILPSLDENSALIAKSISQEQGLQSKIVDVQAFVKHQGLQTDALHAYPELLHMQMLANGYMPPNMAPQAVTFQSKLKQTQFWIRIASAVMVVCSLASVTMSMIGIRQNQAELKQTQSLLQQAKQAQQQLLEQMPASPLSAPQLKQVDDIAQSLQAQQVLPDRALNIVQQVQAKGVRILQVKWAHTTQSDWHAFDRAPEPIVTAAVVTAQGQTLPLKELVLMDATLPVAQRASYQSVIEMLKAHPDVAQVEVIQAPSQPSTQTVLAGSTHQTTLPPQIADIHFQLKWELKTVDNSNQTNSDKAMQSNGEKQ